MALWPLAGLLGGLSDVGTTPDPGETRTSRMPDELAFLSGPPRRCRLCATRPPTRDAPVLALAHGAGAGQRSPFMSAFAEAMRAPRRHDGDVRFPVHPAATACARPTAGARGRVARGRRRDHGPPDRLRRSIGRFAAGYGESAGALAKAEGGHTARRHKARHRRQVDGRAHRVARAGGSRAPAAGGSGAGPARLSAAPAWPAGSPAGCASAAPHNADPGRTGIPRSVRHRGRGAAGVPVRCPRPSSGWSCRAAITRSRCRAAPDRPWTRCCSACTTPSPRSSTAHHDSDRRRKRRARRHDGAIPPRAGPRRARDDAAAGRPGPVAATGRGRRLRRHARSRLAREGVRRRQAGARHGEQLSRERCDVPGARRRARLPRRVHGGRTRRSRAHRVRVGAALREVPERSTTSA